MSDKIDFKRLSTLSFAQGFTFWVYRPPGPLSDVLGAGYWNDACGTLAAGDRIMCVSEAGAIDLHVCTVGGLDRTVRVTVLAETIGTPR